VEFSRYILSSAEATPGSVITAISIADLEAVGSLPDFNLGFVPDAASPETNLGSPGGTGPPGHFFSPVCHASE